MTSRDIRERSTTECLCPIFDDEIIGILPIRPSAKLSNVIQRLVRITIIGTVFRVEDRSKAKAESWALVAKREDPVQMVAGVRGKG